MATEVDETVTVADNTLGPTLRRWRYGYLLEVAGCAVALTYQQLCALGDWIEAERVNAGMLYSRATMATCDPGPPLSTTTAAARWKSGVQAGLV